MIPQKLELENFLAYHKCDPIDLTGLHLACLAGANGAGKSSLLDAITWALWGKARARRDDDLIYGDEVEMQVRLTFLMDGNQYCVTRYRSRKGRGRSELNLEVWDGDDWRSLAEPTIRDTEQRIVSVLRLDYETFINSAFLMQGRADEFTQKRPAERKAILTEILGLNVWTEYEERAKERLRAVEQEARQIEATLQNIADELAREEIYRQELADAEAKRDGLAEAIAEAEAYARELEAARHDLAHVSQRCDDLERLAAENRAEIEQIDAERADYARRLSEHSEVLAQRDEIEEAVRQLQWARGVDQDCSDRLMAQTDLRNQLSAFEQTITAERSSLSTRLNSLRERHARLAQTIDEGAGAESVLDEQQEKLDALLARQVERDSMVQRMEELRAEHRRLQDANESLKAETETLFEQQEEIEASGAVCPLCQQELTDEHRMDLAAQLERQRIDKAEQHQANTERLRQVNSEMMALSREIQKAEGELRGLQPLNQLIARLESQRDAARDARDNFAEVETELAEIEALLMNEAFAPDARAGLVEVQHALAELGYDEQAHREARRLIAELSPVESRKADLDYALKNMPEIEAQIARLDEKAAARSQKEAALLQELEQVRGEREGLAATVSELQPWEDALQTRRDQHGQAQSLVGAARQKINALEVQRQRQADLLAQSDRLAEEHGIYAQLKEAFGRDGIPAMIIEATIPEIETEANEILARMTDGRMHIRFDTQREKVTGGVMETLDIKIADELGTRDYDTFSGGEAFRVNFAIRLALSRLLARRAGARLRTLIMDEGFGTQDSQGRERLIQAINAIKDDFDLILVITHIDELKDAFPVRIEVTKTPTGSVVDIV